MGLSRLKIRRRWWQPSTPVLLPGKSHGQRSLVGCGPWGHKESDTTERLHFHFSPSCIEEGNGNPLQCSCLENPRDGGARWAAVYGVAQSRTRLKRLSSSSSSKAICIFCSWTLYKWNDSNSKIKILDIFKTWWGSGAIRLTYIGGGIVNRFNHFRKILGSIY